MESETKIIKHGIFGDPVRFSCKCGCVYETTDISVNIYNDHSAPRGSRISVCSSHCPECFMRNIVERRFTVEEVSGNAAD